MKKTCNKKNEENDVKKESWRNESRKMIEWKNCHKIKKKLKWKCWKGIIMKKYMKKESQNEKKIKNYNKIK